MAKDAGGAGDIERGVAAIRAAIKTPFPKTALILGSGLGPFADRVENAADVPYSAIPGFPIPTVAGHHGRLRVGISRRPSARLHAGTPSRL